MIFQNIDFHNVEQLVPCEDGWQMYRVPESVRLACDEGLRTTAGFSTGVELRFVLQGEYADIHLRALPAEEGQMAYVYFGSIQGGWQQSAFILKEERTVIRIRRPENLEQLRRISRENSLPFSPEVCRLVLPYGSTVFLGVEGAVTPPTPEMLPRHTLLCYGSSITHGSLALAAPYTYAFRMAQRLGMDYLNLGFAGTCHCERAMAEWLVSRKDWDVATVEMGINMMGMEAADFERRVDEFTAIMAADGRPVFATSIFGYNGDHCGADQDRGEQYRAIVRKYAQPRLRFTEGTALLNRADFITQDMVHPSLEGVAQIASRWTDILSAGLAKERFC